MKDSKLNQCEICKEPTKKVTGFADGHDKNGSPVHWLLYTCGNKACSYFTERAEDDVISMVRAVNKRNKVDIGQLRNKIKSTGNTMGSVGEMLGVGAVKVSDWLNEIKEMPKDIYDRLMNLLSR